MATLSLTKLAVAAGSLALSLSLSAGAGLAAANPDIDAVVNTTCTYSQVDRALHAENPEAAAQLDAAGGWTAVSLFMSAGPDSRRKLANTYAKDPQIQQYFGTISQIAGSCHNY